MSCDYKINGEVTVRRSPEVIEALEFLRTEVFGEDYVEIVAKGGDTLDVFIDYDDVSTIHTPGHVKDFLESIAPDVIGSAAFEIMTDGETWTEWIGDPSAIKHNKSRLALATVEEIAGDLLSEHMARAIELLVARQAQLADNA
jgi:hypothetical protein